MVPCPRPTPTNYNISTNTVNTQPLSIKHTTIPFLKCQIKWTYILLKKWFGGKNQIYNLHLAFNAAHQPRVVGCPNFAVTPNPPTIWWVTLTFLYFKIQDNRLIFFILTCKFKKNKFYAKLNFYLFIYKQTLFIIYSNNIMATSKFLHSLYILSAPYKSDTHLYHHNTH